MNRESSLLCRKILGMRGRRKQWKMSVESLKSRVRINNINNNNFIKITDNRQDWTVIITDVCYTPGISLTQRMVSATLTLANFTLLTSLETVFYYLSLCVLSNSFVNFRLLQDCLDTLFFCILFWIISNNFRNCHFYISNKVFI